MSKRAILIVNLGSPDSTSVRDVRSYLNEFLSDDRVFDLPKPIQQCVLKFFILPKRPRRSAHAYKKIWRPEGSPLKIISHQVRSLLEDRVNMPVFLAMRYGTPSISVVIEEIARQRINEFFLVPLYPHYAMSSYESVVARVEEVARIQSQKLTIATLQPFYDQPGYIEALYQSARPHLDRGFDHLLFSYHGIPVRHLRKADSSRHHCTIVEDCCTTCSPAHATCYKAQCLKTTEAFVERAKIAGGNWSMSFQSRLAGEPWIEPYTDKELVRLGESGTKRLLVITPAFVSDCLETLEEIAIAGRNSFIEAGGREFVQIPCMNDHPEWIRFLERHVREWMGR